MRRVDGALPGKQDGTKSLDLLAPAGEQCYLYAEQVGVKCIIVNHAVLRYFIRSRQPYYGWWFYFLVNNAASGKLSTISPALVPKNAAEVDALLNASIPCKYCIFEFVLFAG